jgi:hypothetical protein
VALRLCRVAAESAGRRGDHAQLVEHSIARKGSSNRLERLLFRGRDLHLPQYLAQCAPALVWSEQPGCRERKRRGRGLCARPPSLRSENARDTLLRGSLNEVLPDPCIPLYPCLLQKEVDRFWVLVQSYRACWIRLGCCCSQRVCEFIERLSSVRTNLDEARGASHPRAPVEQLDHMHQQLSCWVPVQ